MIFWSTERLFFTSYVLFDPLSCQTAPYSHFTLVTRCRGCVIQVSGHYQSHVTTVTLPRHRRIIAVSWFRNTPAPWCPRPSPWDTLRPHILPCIFLRCLSSPRGPWFIQCHQKVIPGSLLGHVVLGVPQGSPRNPFLCLLWENLHQRLNTSKWVFFVKLMFGQITTKS